jgi:hypothetical protein
LVAFRSSLDDNVCVVRVGNHRYKWTDCNEETWAELRNENGRLEYSETSNRGKVLSYLGLEGQLKETVLQQKKSHLVEFTKPLGYCQTRNPSLLLLGK